MRRAILIVLAVGGGCARVDRQITPTTLGTAPRDSPRGRMIPQPFPGSDLAKSAPKVDPATAVASGDEAKSPQVR